MKKTVRSGLWTTQFTLSVCIVFLVNMCANIVLTALPVFASKLTGLDTYAGLMVSLFTLSALCVRPVAGWMVDRFSCKKVIFSGMMIMAVVAFLFINVEKIHLAFIYRFLQGIGYGLSSTGSVAYVAKNCPGDRMLEGISYGSIANSLTSAVGPSIAFALLGADYTHFKTLFICAFLICLVALLLIFFSRDAQISEAGKSNAVIENIGEKIQWLLLVMPAIILFLNTLTQSVISSFVSLYAISLGLAGAGSFFTINALGMITSRFIMNRLVKRFGEFHMILLNVGIFFLSVLSLAYTKSISALCFLAFPAGFAMGSIAPIINTYLVSRMPQNRSGVASAVYYIALDLGYVIGSVFWGLVAARFGYAHMFIAAAMVQICSGVFCLLHMYKFKMC